MCLTMNVLLGGNYNLYESLDNTTVIETWTISESVAANQDSDNTTYFKPLLPLFSHPKYATNQLRLHVQPSVLQTEKIFLVLVC